MPILPLAEFDNLKENLSIHGNPTSSNLMQYIDYAGNGDLFLWLRGTLKFDIYNSNFNSYGVKLEPSNVPDDITALQRFETHVLDHMKKDPTLYGTDFEWNSHLKEDEVLSFSISDRVRNSNAIKIVRETFPGNPPDPMTLAEVSKGSEITLLFQPRWIYKINVGNKKQYGLTFDVRRIVVNKLMAFNDSTKERADQVEADEDQRILDEWVPTNSNKRKHGEMVTAHA